MRAELDIIISINTQKFFHHIGFALYINLICWYLEQQGVIFLVPDNNLEEFKYSFYSALFNFFPDKPVDIAVIYFNEYILYFIGLDIHNFRRDISSCDVPEKHSSSFEGPVSNIRVGAPFKPE